MDTLTQLRCAIEHTLLRPEAQEHEIRTLCQEAIEHRFFGVCVTPVNVSTAAQALKQSQVKVVSVAGFPLGTHKAAIKAKEAELCVADGAHEIDIVMALGLFKDQRYQSVEADIKQTVTAVAPHAVKVIIETGLLSQAEIETAAKLVAQAGAHFVKTCSGFAAGHATAHDVALIRKTIGPSLGIKASGGVRSQKDARLLLEAGANRIGTSQALSLISAHA